MSPTSHGWFIHRDDNRIGPVGDSDIRRLIVAGELRGSDLVWRQGLADWIEASTVPGWFIPPEERRAAVAGTLPPLPPAPPAPSDQRSTPTSLPKAVPRGEHDANYFVRHWRGELSLPIAYWVNGTLVTIAAAVFALMVAEVDMTRQPQFGAVVYLMLVAVILVATPWQLVGIWRSADHHTTRGGTGLWAGAAKVAVALGLLNTLSELGTTIIPATREMMEIAAGDSGLSTHHIRVLRNASEVEVSGDIGFGLTDELTKVLDAHPTVVTLHLNSRGGRVVEAQKLRDMIAARALRTYTSTECASACVLAFMAGSERLLGPDAKIGLHSASVGGNSATPDDYAADYEFARRQRIDPELLRKGFATPPESMWYPTPQELLAANLVTRLAGPTEMAFSGLDVSKVTRAHMENTFDQIPLYRALKAHEPEAYRTAVDATIDAVLRGDSIANARAATTPVIQSIVKQRLPLASDEVMLRFGILVVEQLTALRQHDPLMCYGFAFGESASVAQAIDFLPAEIQSRDLEVSAQIIDSSAKPHQRSALSATEWEAVVGDIVASLDTRHLPALQWLGAGAARSDQQKGAVCDLMIDLYSAMNTLPPETAAPLLRGMFSEEQS